MDSGDGVKLTSRRITPPSTYVKELDVETKDKKPVEVVHTSNAGNVDHLSKIPSQQEQAKPTEGLPRSSKVQGPYSMPQEYYDKLDKQARVLTTSLVKYCITASALNTGRFIATREWHPNGNFAPYVLSIFPR
uniref:Uncharacterized protein n=1 Tax=Oryza punctata TaxID=4537 RepID=A0A0E0KMK8_ORYPU